MKLSIIIPVYNVEKHIGRCLDSLLLQDLDINEYEIILINDGSKDDSIFIATKYQQKHSNIFIYHQKNAGVGSARNKGINLAKGEHIYFIDPDDYLASNVLKTILDYINDHDLEVLTFLSIGTLRTDLKASNSNNDISFAVNKMTGINYIGEMGYKNEVWWYIVKKSFLKEIGIAFISGRWMEDAIFTTELLIKAQNVAYLPIDAHRHVKVEGSAINSKEAEHYIKVIYDQANAVKEFSRFVEEVRHSEPLNLECLNRLEARHQSLVFFMMIRILKSKITFNEVKIILKKMIEIGAYPLNKFTEKEYNKILYVFITKLFNFKYIYYILFLILNPFLRRYFK